MQLKSDAFIVMAAGFCLAVTVVWKCIIL